MTNLTQLRNECYTFFTGWQTTKLELVNSEISKNHHGRVLLVSWFGSTEIFCKYVMIVVVTVLMMLVIWFLLKRGKLLLDFLRGLRDENEFLQRIPQLTWYIIVYWCAFPAALRTALAVFDVWNYICFTLGDIIHWWFVKRGK